LRRARAAKLDPAWVYTQLLKLHPPAATGPVSVAFSGGNDSTALLSLLAEVPALHSRLRALHIDHGLHADSRSWARACRAHCRLLQVPLVARRVTVVRAKGQSLEALARSARYGALAAAMRPDLAHYTEALRSVRATLSARNRLRHQGETPD